MFIRRCWSSSERLSSLCLYSLLIYALIGGLLVSFLKCTCNLNTFVRPRFNQGGDMIILLWLRHTKRISDEGFIRSIVLFADFWSVSCVESILSTCYSENNLNAVADICWLLMICIGLLQVNRLGIVAVSEYLDFYFILFLSEWLLCCDVL